MPGMREKNAGQRRYQQKIREVFSFAILITAVENHITMRFLKIIPPLLIPPHFEPLLNPAG
jgi:hypothetical protein